MNKHIFALIIILTCYQLSYTGGKIQFSAAPSFGYNFGKTEYILEVRGTLDSLLGSPRTYTIKSQLEYPLDVAMAGFNLHLFPVNDHSLWSVTAGIFTNLNNPGGIMKDSDWQELNGFFDLTKFSYTESKAEMSSFVLNLEASYRIIKFQPVSVSLLAGLRYQKIKQDVIGYEGWQRPFDSSLFVLKDPVTISGSGKVLYYEITFKQPQIGLLTKLDFNSYFFIDIKTVYTPVFYNDLDDHILRNKLSISDGSGNGFIASVTTNYQFRTNKKVRPFIGFTTEIITLSASGSQVQKWYDDETYTDPNTNNPVIIVPKGTAIGGIPHEITNTQYRISFKAGFIF
ncbi:MAG: omptin family outer membrane protease [Candidatus Zixiibacteriota bacterium]